jgi:hypothetical protein
MGITIKRTRKIGKGWPLAPGFPYNEGKTGYHLVEINGLGFVFLWRANKEKWSSGIRLYSPEEFEKYDYRGECYPVYKAPPVLIKPKWKKK